MGLGGSNDQLLVDLGRVGATTERPRAALVFLFSWAALLLLLLLLFGYGWTLAATERLAPRYVQSL